MLTYFILHWLIIIVVLRQLLNFKTRWFWAANLCSLSTLISILIVLIINRAIWFLLTVNSIILTYVYGVWIILICLSLSWLNLPFTLDICFLSCASPSTANSSWITSTIILRRLWVEILSSSWKSWQYILVLIFHLVLIFQWFIYFWNSLISTLRLKMMNYPLVGISCWSLTTNLVLSLNSFFVLFYMRAKSSSISRFFYFVFNCT